MLLTPKCDYQPANLGHERLGREERVAKTVGNEESRVEAIHIALAMQFAGFCQVPRFKGRRMRCQANYDSETNKHQENDCRGNHTVANRQKISTL